MNEKTALLGPLSHRADSTTQYLSTAKISSIITVLIILVITIVINHPTKNDNFSESFSNLGGVLSSYYTRETPGNESNILLNHSVNIICIFKKNTILYF